MTTHKPTGWNTWDYRGFNRFSFLNKGKLVISLHYAIWDDQVPPPEPDSKQIGKLQEIMRWDNATKLGPHGPLGMPAELDFQVDDTPFRASAWTVNDEFYLHVRPLGDTHKRVVFIFDAPDGETVVRSGPHAGKFAKCDVTLEHAAWPERYFMKIAEPFAVGPAGWGVSIKITPPGRNVSTGTDETNGPGTFEHYAENTLAGSGALADAPQAMTQAVLWNTLYDARRQLVSSPVSRDWCYDWRGVLVFCWDTYLVGTFVSYDSPELARLNIEAVNAAIDEIGHVPNYYMAHGAKTLDRSMPPIGAYLTLKTQRANPDKKWLTKAYKQFTTWHKYWKTHRDGNGSGLFSWGSNAEPEYEFKEIEPYNGVPRHTKQSAMYESGLDNSPMFDEAGYDEKSGCLELDDVALSSYYAMDCEALAEMAELLGKKADAKRYRAEHAEISAKINELLWDGENSIYCNRHWDGRLSKRWAPTSFFPLIAGVAPRERAERMVREHLLNDKEFGGKYVIPSISRSDPAYPDNDYWRGRIWGPFNFLVIEGLRRYRLDDTACELATKSLDMFMENWRADGGVYENYNADDGRGADVWNAARLYHWGGLLAYVGMQELIDVEPTGFLRVGSVKFANAGLRNIRLGNDVYEVELGEGVRVKRNGQLFTQCDTRAIIRIPLKRGDAPLEITAAGDGELTIYAVDGMPAEARVNAQKTVTGQIEGDAIHYAW